MQERARALNSESLLVRTTITASEMGDRLHRVRERTLCLAADLVTL